MSNEAFAPEVAPDFPEGNKSNSALLLIKTKIREKSVSSIKRKLNNFCQELLNNKIICLFITNSVITRKREDY